jgi:hypothetical protein
MKRTSLHQGFSLSPRSGTASNNAHSTIQIEGFIIVIVLFEWEFPVDNGMCYCRLERNDYMMDPSPYLYITLNIRGVNGYSDVWESNRHLVSGMKVAWWDTDYRPSVGNVEMNLSLADRAKIDAMMIRINKSRALL